MDNHLQLKPISIREAKRYVAKHHRHHRPPQGAKFAIGATRDGSLVGVITVGRPVARHLDNGYTAEVTRCCTNGDAHNAASKLYSAAWRAARAMGYTRIVTYTLDTETGTSLKAAGWSCTGPAGGDPWNCPSRPRADDHPTGPKIRWEKSACPTAEPA
jgi:hypothetical protein